MKLQIYINNFDYEKVELPFHYTTNHIALSEE